MLVCVLSLCVCGRAHTQSHPAWFLSQLGLFFHPKSLESQSQSLTSFPEQLENKNLRHTSAASLSDRVEMKESRLSVWGEFSRPPIGHLVLEVAHFEQVLFICFFNRVPNFEFPVCPRKLELRRNSWLQMLDVLHAHWGDEERSLPEGDLSTSLKSRGSSLLKCSHFVKRGLKRLDWDFETPHGGSSLPLWFPTVRINDSTAVKG